MSDKVINLASIQKKLEKVEEEGERARILDEYTEKASSSESAKANNLNNDITRSQVSRNKGGAMSVDNDVARLQGESNGLKHSQTIILASAGLLVAAFSITFGLMTFSVQNLKDDMRSDLQDLKREVQTSSDETRVEVRALQKSFSDLQGDINEQFRAMQIQNAAQTSAIANSITATKALQPSQREDSEQTIK